MLIKITSACILQRTHKKINRYMCHPRVGGDPDFSTLFGRIQLRRIDSRLRGNDVICMKHTGYILIDKPVDWTSHDAVAYVRGMVRSYIKEHGGPVKAKNVRVGHAGTLDPFATGLLIIGIGREATKKIDEFKGMNKSYIATLELGATSDTQDLTGTITKYTGTHTTPITENQIVSVLGAFVGKQQQIPPMYSAKKVGGQKLYDLARAGKTIERQPSDIEIFTIELLFVTTDSTEDITSFTIRVSCSTGTYIRTLCEDIGAKLGTGAYCSALRRTDIGEYSVEHAVGPKDLSNDTWVDRLFER